MELANLLQKMEQQILEISNKSDFDELNVSSLTINGIKILNGNGELAISLGVESQDSKITLYDNESNNSVDLIGSSLDNGIIISKNKTSSPYLFIGDYESEYSPNVYLGFLSEKHPFYDEDFYSMVEHGSPVSMLNGELNKNIVTSYIVADTNYTLTNFGPIYGNNYIAQIGVTSNSVEPKALIGIVDTSSMNYVASLEVDKDNSIFWAQDIDNEMFIMGGAFEDEAGLHIMDLSGEQITNLFLGYDDTRYLDYPKIQVMYEDEIIYDFQLKE